MPVSQPPKTSLSSGISRFFVLFLVCVGGIFFLLIGSILPRTISTIFASPDETAVAAVAHGWTWDRGFSLSSNLPSVLRGLSGLHPRSMVQLKDRLVPVGFLGMSMLIVPLERAVAGSGSFLTLFLVLSAAYPLWQIASAAGKKAAWGATLFFLSFPTVLLYVNRGLFPNLPVVAFALWGYWALQRRSEDQAVASGLIAGLSIGLALIIRPIEALWLVPWMIWAAWGRKMDRRLMVTVSLVAIICALGYFASVMTYGTWMPVIGYWLHDALPVVTAGNVTAPSSASLRSFLPFGFHPRAMWENIRLYFFGMFGLWTAAALLGMAWWLRSCKTLKQVVPLILTAWTGIVLLLMYGQSLYADNIRGHVTLGNSFLRYMLPLVPLVAIGIGMLIERLAIVPYRGRLLSCALLTFFVLFGVVNALQRDEESIFSTRTELERYKTIQAAARRLLPPGAIILSDRSDKIFVGGPFMAVSPMPDESTLRQLHDSHVPLAVFTRTLDADHVASFVGGALGDLSDPAVTAIPFENETLYVLDAGQPLP